MLEPTINPRGVRLAVPDALATLTITELEVRFAVAETPTVRPVAVTTVFIDELPR
jgi:hypothetical protein